MEMATTMVAMTVPVAVVVAVAASAAASLSAVNSAGTPAGATSRGQGNQSQEPVEKKEVEALKAELKEAKNKIEELLAGQAVYGE